MIYLNFKLNFLVCNTLKKRELGEELEITKNPAQLNLLKGGINGDDDRADSEELQVEEEADHQHQIALNTTGHGVGEKEWELLKKMNQIILKIKLEFNFSSSLVSPV